MSDDPRAAGSDALDELARMAGSVAHDLNNMLTSIKGLAALALQELPAQDPIRRDIEEIQKAAVRATTRTAELRAMARAARSASPTAGGSAPAGATVAPPGPGPQRNVAGGPGDEPVVAAAPPRTSQVVLVADDEDSVRKLVVRVLARAGYQVLEARDTAQALELAERVGGRIDLLLTDVVMPRAGGHQLYRLISDRWPRVRVLYMSGYTDDPDVRREAEGPGGAYLEKPFAPEELIATVRRVLDRDSQTLADR